MSDERERRAEVKEQENHKWADLGSGGEEIGEPGPGIESTRVVDALAPPDEAVLLVVCPVADGRRNLAVDDCGYGFVVRVF